MRKKIKGNGEAQANRNSRMSGIVVGEALVQPCVRGYGIPEDKLVGARLANATLNIDGEAIFVPCDPGRGMTRHNAVQPGGFGQKGVQSLRWGEDFRGNHDF